MAVAECQGSTATCNEVSADDRAVDHLHDA
jgi:hypothetical protein